VSYVGSFFSYVNDARSHKPEALEKLTFFLFLNKRHKPHSLKTR